VGNADICVCASEAWEGCDGRAVDVDCLEGVGVGMACACAVVELVLVVWFGIGVVEG